MIGLVAQALADDPSLSWEHIYDARLVEAADGTPEVAARFYEEILSDLGAEDPLRPSVAYSLGRARLAAGNTDGAIAALRLAIEGKDVRPQAGALLALIEQERRQVTTLPYSNGFANDVGAFVRGWQGFDDGELAIGPVDGNPAMAWPTVVRAGGSDEITIGLAPGVDLRDVHLRLRAAEFPAVVRLGCTDGAGGRFGAGTVVVPTDAWVDVRVPVTTFRSLRSAVGEAPRRVRTLIVEDLTGSVSSDRGANVVWIDDVELR